MSVSGAADAIHHRVADYLLAAVQEDANLVAALVAQILDVVHSFVEAQGNSVLTQVINHRIHNFVVCKLEQARVAVHQGYPDAQRGEGAAILQADCTAPDDGQGAGNVGEVQYVIT